MAVIGEDPVSSGSVASVPEVDLLVSFFIHAGADLGADKKFEYVAFERSSRRTFGASLVSFAPSMTWPTGANSKGFV